MKFYNPFKPHIVQFGSGKYAVRRLTLLVGYQYIDRDTTYWWGTDEYVDRYCVFNTLYDVEYFMYQYITAKNQKKSDRKVTVL